MLQVSGARRRFGERAALDRVSLTIDAGEIYALLGRNGAGKSTLAKAAIGAVALDDGFVRVLGADPAIDLSVRRAIGVAPQEIALYPRLTVAENLAAFAALAGAPGGKRRRQAVAEALDLAACTPRAKDRVETLSGGWRRRANLAAALVHRPRFLVLDEPTEGLDAETRAVLAAVLRRLRESGTAVLLISHDALEVADLADRIGVLHQGRLIAEGPPARLLSEAFGGREELVLRLLAPPTAGQTEWLGVTGLVAAEGGLVWRGLLTDAAAMARSLHDRLLAESASFRELAVRPPGLDALTRRLTDGLQ